MQVFDVARKQCLATFDTASPETTNRCGWEEGESVAYWTFLQTDELNAEAVAVLAIVTDKAVYHWAIKSEPNDDGDDDCGMERVFEVDDEMLQCQIISYKAIIDKDDFTWCMLSGIKSVSPNNREDDDDDKVISGCSQLWHCGKQSTQVIEGAVTGTFGTTPFLLTNDRSRQHCSLADAIVEEAGPFLAFVSNNYPEDRKGYGGLWRVQIVPIDVAEGKPRLPKHQVMLLNGKSSNQAVSNLPTDFPIGLHWHRDSGLLVCVGKTGNVFLVDPLCSPKDPVHAISNILHSNNNEARLEDENVGLDTLFASVLRQEDGVLVACSKSGRVLEWSLLQTPLFTQTTPANSTPGSIDSRSLLLRALSSPRFDFQQYAGAIDLIGECIECYPALAARLFAKNQKLRSDQGIYGKALEATDDHPLLSYLDHLLTIMNEKTGLSECEAWHGLLAHLRLGNQSVIDTWLVTTDKDSKAPIVECTESLADALLLSAGNHDRRGETSVNSVALVNLTMSIYLRCPAPNLFKV